MLRNVAKILSGTVIAQLLLVFSTPFITRLYTPEDFGDFAAFMGVLGILGVVASYRYELAIAEAVEDRLAHIIFKTVVILCTLNFFLLICVFGLIVLTNTESFNYIYYFIPISFFANGLFQISMITALRDKLFTLVSAVKIIQAVILILTQVILDEWGAIGLCIAQLLSAFIGLFVIALASRKFPNKKSRITRLKLKFVLYKYSNYFKFSALASFLNTIGMHIPILILSYSFSPFYAGLYAVATRLLLMPANLITNAISKVLLSEARVFGCKKQVKSLFQKNIDLQLLLILLPLIILCTIDANLYSLALGSEWGGVSSLVIYFAPWVFISFLTNPCLIVLETTKKQSIVLLFQVLMLTLRLLVLYIGYLVSDAPFTLQIFAYISALCWLCLFLFFSKYYSLDIWKKVLTAFLVLMFFSIMGFEFGYFSTLLLMPYSFYLYKGYKRLRNV